MCNFTRQKIVCPECSIKLLTEKGKTKCDYIRQVRSRYGPYWCDDMDIMPKKYLPDLKADNLCKSCSGKLRDATPPKRPWVASLHADSEYPSAAEFLQNNSKPTMADKSHSTPPSKTAAPASKKSDKKSKKSGKKQQRDQPVLCGSRGSWLYEQGQGGDEDARKLWKVCHALEEGHPEGKEMMREYLRQCEP